METKEIKQLIEDYKEQRDSCNKLAEDCRKLGDETGRYYQAGKANAFNEVVVDLMNRIKTIK